MRSPKLCGRVPRGTLSVTDQMRAAARLYAEGLKPREVAARLGIPAERVVTYAKRVHDAEVDARNVRRIAGER